MTVARAGKRPGTLSKSPIYSTLTLERGQRERKNQALENRGQAIVGNVSPGGGVSSKLEGQPHAPPALTHEPGQTLPSEIETVREAVQSTSG